MNELEKALVERAKALLKSGEVSRVVAWKRGEFPYDAEPAVFETEEELASFVYDDFCGANLSKYLIAKSALEGKTLVFLKPCDSFSLAQLFKEHRVKKEKVYVIGIECQGKIDIDLVKKAGVNGITAIADEGERVRFETLYGDTTLSKKEIISERCRTCKSKEFAVADETIVLHEMKKGEEDRFARVKELEAMTPNERFAFWRKELSRCIRCNACRTVCPACSCVKCVFDNPKSGIAAKANDDPFEEQLFHIIRAYHVAGRCTDCGECSRVCPQNIPLHLLNRKFIKDINGLYGEYQAGSQWEGKHPLTEFKEGDPDPMKAVEEEF